MSAANWEEVKKRYNFKELNVATWRHPSTSVHPARGGDTSQHTIAATDVAKPYMPTYRYMIKPPRPPEPTDDEESSDDGTDAESEEELEEGRHN
jgi:hypothetical protein